jgi:multidrug efflux pump subunit AcrA (membrane-fusion protein)
MKTWTTLGIAALVAAAVGATTLRRTGTTAVVAAGPVKEFVVARGAVIAADGVADVVAEREGRVLRVLVQRGDHVDAGQALAELGPADVPVTLTSPIAGTVLARRIDPGDMLSRAEPLAPFQIADVSKTMVVIEVEQADAARLSTGLEVTLSHTGGREPIGKGTVSRLAQNIERRTLGSDTVGVRAEGWVRTAWVDWRDKPPHVLVGQQVEARLLVGSRQAAARAPREAVVIRDGHAVVDAKWGLWSYAVAVEPREADERFVEIEGVPLGTTVFLK